VSTPKKKSTKAGKRVQVKKPARRTAAKKAAPKKKAAAKKTAAKKPAKRAATKKFKYDVADLGLAKKGKDRLEWAYQQMPVLEGIRRRFEREKPLKGIRVVGCLHMTTETGNLARVLKAGGAEAIMIASNPLSTQDDVCASLVKDYGIPVFARHGVNNREYYKQMDAALESNPQIVMDDGADTVSRLMKRGKKSYEEVLGGTEETTTGIIRLKAMEDNGALGFPMVGVNESKTKHFFDNRYGTGQSTLDGIIRATNRLIAGSTFVVCGYGWCSKGMAMRASGAGARVVVTEVDALKALEAVMDGHTVMPIAEAARVGDFFCSITGNINVIRKEHFRVMKDGAILCNSGHFDVEIQIPGLKALAKKVRERRDNVTEYEMKNGRRIYLLGQGRLVNLACAEGHPSSVMDMSFANQALAAEYIVKNQGKLDNKVYVLPEKVDQEIARIKLGSMGMKFDKLTKEQRDYLASWEHGT